MGFLASFEAKGFWGYYSTRKLNGLRDIVPLSRPLENLTAYTVMLMEAWCLIRRTDRLHAGKNPRAPHDRK